MSYRYSFEMKVILQHCHTPCLLQWLGSVCHERSLTRWRITSGFEGHLFHVTRSIAYLPAMERIGGISTEKKNTTVTFDNEQ